MRGICASPGMAAAEPLTLSTIRWEDVKTSPAKDIAAERKRLEGAVEQVRTRLAAMRARFEQEGAQKQEVAAILKAHLALLEDPELLDEAGDRIREKGVCAEYALREAVESIAEELAEVDDPYIKERIADIRDVAAQLVSALLGIEQADLSALERDVVLVAEELEPSVLIAADQKHIAGIVCERGGPTSHVAILSRSMGIPAVFGVAGAVNALRGAKNVMLDATNGTVEQDLSEEELARAREQIEKLRALRASLAAFEKLAGRTADGRAIPVRCNIGDLNDARKAKAVGAQGVGLFRTEFLYMDSPNPPSEEEQFEVYRAVLELFPNDPVTIRTLDAGGDKNISYFDLPSEENPFLGCRAIRLCLNRPDIFRVQLRALLRASVYGKLRIMYPMISSLSELRAANAVLEEVKKELMAEGKAVSETLEVGMMVEIPAAAICAAELAREVDFFSIGTNDLTQYTLAVDRGNANIAALYNEFHPAVLELIRMTADGAHRAGIHTCICGELGGNALATRMLLALGIDELSMGCNSISRTKKILSETDCATLARLPEQLKGCGADEKAVREMLRRDVDEAGLSYLLGL